MRRCRNKQKKFLYKSFKRRYYRPRYFLPLVNKVVENRTKSKIKYYVKNVRICNIFNGFDF